MLHFKQNCIEHPGSLTGMLQGFLPGNTLLTAALNLAAGKRLRAAYEPSASCVWVSVLTAVPTKRCTLSLRLPSIYSCCRFPLNIRVSGSGADLQSDSRPILLCTLREHCYFPPLCLALVTSLNYAIISVLKSPLALLGCQLHTSSTMSVVPSIITASLLGSPWPSPGAPRLQTIQWMNEWMSSNVSITVLTLRIILLFRDIFLAEWGFWVLIHQIINLFIFGVLRMEPWGGIGQSVRLLSV